MSSVIKYPRILIVVHLEGFKCFIIRWQKKGKYLFNRRWIFFSCGRKNYPQRGRGKAKKKINKKRGVKPPSFLLSAVSGERSRRKLSPVVCDRRQSLFLSVDAGNKNKNIWFGWCLFCAPHSEIALLISLSAVSIASLPVCREFASRAQLRRIGVFHRGGRKA